MRVDKSETFSTCRAYSLEFIERHFVMTELSSSNFVSEGPKTVTSQERLEPVHSALQTKRSNKSATVPHMEA